MMPAFPLKQSPGGTVTYSKEEPASPSKSLPRVWKTPATPEVSPSSSSRPKKPRRLLKRDDKNITKFLTDSSSEVESDEDDGNIQKVMPAIPLNQSPGGTVTSSKKEPASTSKSRRRVWKSPATPKVSPSSSSSPKKARPSLKRDDKNITKFSTDSGSEVEFDEGDGEEEAYNIVYERERMRRLRYNEVMIYEDGCEDTAMDEEILIGDEENDYRDGPTNEERVISEGLDECEVAATNEEIVIKEEVNEDYVGLDDFSWSEDFSSFSGQEETYLRVPGPKIEARDPVPLFLEVWDERIMDEIVRETNKYAWKFTDPLYEKGVAKSLNWTDTTVAEMYRYFAMLIYMSICYRSSVKDYWTTDFLEMPSFRKAMPRERFLNITRFLHFVDNDTYDPKAPSYEKKLFKIRPIINHCNKKFADMYTPSKHLSLDESLLLWKGRLSWVQCIRTKAARFGIKSIELCEAVTGYQLRSLVYAGKNSSMSAGSIHGFENCTAKVVLELMDGYLDVGHTLIMDNWYNQLSLTRFLKRRRTNVIGTLNRRRIHIPDDIKNANEKRMLRGERVARHCGDISLIAWKDVKLVTTISTYHSDQQVPAQRLGKPMLKPASVVDYNKYMGGVDSKDQKLSMYMMERKRGQKWYMKVFKRLLNTSLLNAFIIHNKNPMPKPLSHRKFRMKVAEGLLERFTKCEVTPINSTPPRGMLELLDQDKKRLLKVDHFVVNTAKMSGTNRLKQLRCKRCSLAGRRSMVTLKCLFCDVPLCPGSCWIEYHSSNKL